MNTTSDQLIGGHTVSIMKSRNSQKRYALIDGNRSAVVPVEMLPFTCSRDQWMRRILVKCSNPECRKPTPAGEMEGGYHDVCCQVCFELAGEENARADGLR